MTVRARRDRSGALRGSSRSPGELVCVPLLEPPEHFHPQDVARGLRRYDTPDVLVLSGAEDIVPVPDPDAPADVTRYRPRTEGLFALIHRHRDDKAGYDY